MTNDLNDIRNLLKTTSTQLFGHAGVVATGIGYKVSDGKTSNTPALVCSVEKKLPKSQLQSSDLVPEKIDGFPTDVIETGRIRAFQGHTDRHRPAPGGISIGHREITAGTLGCVVKKGGQRVILSNNHVLANSNDAALGDAILQPGPHDNGSFPADHIANLEAFVEVTFLIPEIPSDCKFATGVISVLNAGCTVIGSRTRYRITRPIMPSASGNLVDAAIARPINDADVSDEILEIGQISDVADATLGMEIQKSGRTTGHTTGQITQVDVTVNVNYGGTRIAMFEDQLMAGAMSQGGDSGSAVLDMDRRLVGLLFAGSDSSTIMNRIGNVFSTLGLSL
jgi:hypothetical protein